MRTFAYGSNMDPVQMASRCPGAVPLRTAMLPGYRVAFVGDPGGFDGGVATIVADPAAQTWGVVWKISQAHLGSLDEWEGFPHAYDRVTMTIADEEAFVYVARSATTQAPAPAYLDGILRGARAHGLPAEYVARLERFSG